MILDQFRQRLPVERPAGAEQVMGLVVGKNDFLLLIHQQTGIPQTLEDAFQHLISLAEGCRGSSEGHSSLLQPPIEPQGRHTKESGDNNQEDKKGGHGFSAPALGETGLKR